MLQFRIPLAVTGRPVVGERMVCEADWDALPKLDGGRALEVMRASLKLSHVRWETPLIHSSSLFATDRPTSTEGPNSASDSGEASSDEKWTAVPPHAKPFPWDGQELVPTADMVGLVVRPVGTFADKLEGEPVSGLPTSIGASYSIGLSEKLKETVQKVLAQGQIGFHGTSPSDDTRYAGFVGCRGEQLVAVVQRIPDDDGAPVETVAEGELPLHEPGCSLSLDDEVTLSLLFVRQAASQQSSAESPAAVAEEGLFSTTEKYPICVRSRAVRDLVAMSIWALQVQFLQSRGCDIPATASSVLRGVAHEVFGDNK